MTVSHDTLHPDESITECLMVSDRTTDGSAIKSACPYAPARTT